MAEYNVAQAAKPPASARVIEIVGRLIERALRNRVRYRYVRPEVLREEAGWRIVSPCCSRNVDPAGGLIDIALLQRSGASGWTLTSRDRAGGTWVAQDESDQIQDLLDQVCLDPKRVFWP